MSVILDAGPFLNFLAVGQQGVLVELAASRQLQLAVPTRVDREILGVARSARFRRTPAQSTWLKLKSAQRVDVLDDTLTEQELIDAVARTSGMPAEQRVRDGKSLGEIMVLAHASVLVQRGLAVFVLIDDGDGRRRARREQAWLDSAGAPGRLTLWSTPQVLRSADDSWIVGGHSRQVVYDQLRQFDDGLPAMSLTTTIGSAG